MTRNSKYQITVKESVELMVSRVLEGEPPSLVLESHYDLPERINNSTPVRAYYDSVGKVRFVTPGGVLIPSGMSRRLKTLERYANTRKRAVPIFNNYEGTVGRLHRTVNGMRNVCRATESTQLRLYEPNSKWRSEYTSDDLEDALDRLFSAVASDLGIDDITDEAFIDYSADMMSDAKVPTKFIDSAEKWLKSGARAHKLVF